MLQQNLSGLRNSVAIKLPFNVTPQGNVEYTTNFREVWEDRVRSVLLTSRYERANRHDFGTDIYQEILNGTSGIGGAEQNVVAAVYESFSKFLSPSLSLKSVDTDYNYDSGALIVTVSYTLPDNSTQTTVVNSLTIAGNNPPNVTSSNYSEGN